MEAAGAHKRQILINGQPPLANQSELVHACVGQRCCLATGSQWSPWVLAVVCLAVGLTAERNITKDKTHETYCPVSIFAQACHAPLSWKNAPSSGTVGSLQLCGTSVANAGHFVLGQDRIALRSGSFVVNIVET